MDLVKNSGRKPQANIHTQHHPQLAWPVLPPSLPPLKTISWENSHTADLVWKGVQRRC